MHAMDGGWGWGGVFCCAMQQTLFSFLNYEYFWDEGIYFKANNEVDPAFALPVSKLDASDYLTCLLTHPSPPTSMPFPSLHEVIILICVLLLLRFRDNDVSPLSGISGLSFDSTLLSPLLFFCLILILVMSYLFCLQVHSSKLFPENSSIFFVKR